MAKTEAETVELARLRARVAELETIVEVMPNIVARFDAQLRITFVNRYLPGLGPELVLGRPLLDFIAPQSHQVSRETIERVLRTQVPGSYQNEGPGPGGTTAVYHTDVVAERSADGTVGGCLVATDVTRLVRREAAVREREDALQLSLAATRLGLFSWDLATDAVTWDARMHELTGLSTPLRLPEYVERLVHPEDRATVLAGGARASTDGVIGQKHRIVRPDGQVRWVITVGRVQKDAGGRPVRMAGGLLDVTEQQVLEEKLGHAQRLGAVGTLTAGVAHNFNNLLMVILPSLELLRRVVPPSHAQVLADSTSAAERAADLVRKLMTYAGKRTQHATSTCDLGQLAERAVAMCGRSFDPRIALACRVEPGAALVRADPTDVDQVAMNLLYNARDAVLAAKGPAPRIDVEVGEEPARATLFLRVRDNGVGMSAETLARACEPFFTTKGVGAGTGLGLATSSALARELGGRLELQSEPGQGTVATLWLPVTRAAAARAEPAGSAPQPASRRTVLLVDDDQLVRESTARVLEDFGHSVHCAENAAAALALAVRQRYDVVLVDRSLPGMPGAALVPELRAALPGARVYFFTGHDVGPDEARVADGVLQKPVRTEDLLAAIEGPGAARGRR